MLKVSDIVRSHSSLDKRTHYLSALTHSLTHSHTHTLTHSFTHSLALKVSDISFNVISFVIRIYQLVYWFSLIVYWFSFFTGFVYWFSFIG